MKNLYLVLLIGLVIFLGGCNVEITNTESSVVDNTEKTVLVESKIMEELSDFNDIYKKALMTTGKKQVEEAKKTTPMSLSKWEAIEDKYIGQEAKEFSKTSNLDNKWKEIGDYIRKSDSLVKEEKYEEAHEELELVRKELRAMRAENNIVIISDDMLIFHDIMEEIVENGEKNIEELEKLDEKLQILKKYNQDNDQYNKMLSDLEIIVNDLINSEGEDYKNALKSIKPAYIKLYVQFG